MDRVRSGLGIDFMSCKPDMNDTVASVLQV